MQPLPALDARKHRERALHTRLMVAHETALEHHLKRVIVDLGHSAARMHRDHGKEGLAQVMGQAPSRIRQVLRPSLLTTALEFAHRLQQKSTPNYAQNLHGSLHDIETKAFETLDQAMRDWVDIHVGTRIVQISDSVQAAIQEVIRRGIEEGWSETEIASAIEDATGGEIAGWRARRIARTETHTAANAGQYIAAQSSPLDYTKEWLATEDDRTREDHANANGQRVHMLSSFILGGPDFTQGGRFVRNNDGSITPVVLPGNRRGNRDLTARDLDAGMVAMLYPGDPTAPPSQVINCRCTCIYAPILNRPEPQAEPDNPWDTGSYGSLPSEGAGQ